jgi:hypothetical protein
VDFDSLPDVLDVAVFGHVVYALQYGAGVEIYERTPEGGVVHAGHMDGPDVTYAVHVADGFLHLGTQTGLHVYDLDDPEAPKLLSTVIMPDVRTIAAEGSHVYAATWGGALHVVDIGDPAHAVLRGSLDVDAIGLAARGGYVYATSSSLLIVDAARPDTPEVVGSYPLPGGRFVVVDDGIAYVSEEGALSSGRLHLVDVRDPRAPAALGVGEWLDGLPTDLVVRGGMVFLGTVDAYPWQERSWVHVIDASDPRVPRLVGRVSGLIGFASGFAAADTRLFAASYYWGLYTLDVEHTSSPRVIGRVATQDAPRDIARIGRFVVAAAQRATEVFDVSEPADMRRVGTVETPGEAHVVATDGSRVVVGGTQLHVLDLRDPEHPQLGVGLSVPEYVREMAVRGGYAFVGGGTLLRTVDLAGDPEVVGQLEFEESITGLALRGSVAFVATLRGLEVVDVSNPLAPTRMGRVSIDHTVRGLALRGPDVILVGDAISIVSALRPESPSRVRTVDVGDWFWEVLVSGSYAYLAGHRSGLSFLDLDSDPPRIVGSHGLVGEPARLILDQLGLFVCDQSGDIVVTVPHCEPTPAHTHDTASEPNGLPAFYVATLPAGGPLRMTLALPRASTATLEIFDSRGRRVDELLDGRRLRAGSHSVVWSGRVPAGVYWVRLRAGVDEVTRSVVLTR